jgi:hypothetical protein
VPPSKNDSWKPKPITICGKNFTMSKIEIPENWHLHTLELRDADCCREATCRLRDKFGTWENLASQNNLDRLISLELGKI